jgi:group I intron endonuclease
MEDKVYIYTLTDPITSEIRYVGKTNNLIRRYNQHLSRSKDRVYHSALWIKSLVKQGEKPVMDVLEITDSLHWAEREQYWISLFKDRYDLTNLLAGGEGGATYGGLGKKWSKATAEKYRASRKGLTTKQTDKDGKRRQALVEYNRKRAKPIYQYVLDGTFVNEWPSAVDCTKATGFNASDINTVCKDNTKQAYGYMWRYHTGQDKSQIVPYVKKESVCKVKIRQLDKHGSLINDFDSLLSASLKTGVNRTAISNCLTNRCKTSGGFVWKYK